MVCIAHHMVQICTHKQLRIAITLPAYVKLGNSTDRDRLPQIIASGHEIYSMLYEDTF